MPADQAEDRMSDLPKWAKDRIRSNIEFDFDWRDRLKLLLTGKLSVRIETTCEGLPGRVESETQHWLQWPQLYRRRPISFEVQAKETE